MKRVYIYALPVLFFFGSCSQYDKIEKSNDNIKKLQYANSLYDKKKFAQANALYEELIKVYQGTKYSQDLLYRYAYSFYYEGDFTSAAFYFKNFEDNYPNDPRSTDADYMKAKSFYEMSPRPELDQSNTNKALDAMQEFINEHPNSSRLKDANTIIDDCHRKLEEKLFLSAQLYYNLEYYNAASIYFHGLLQQYPDSKKGDLYKFMVIKSDYQYAYNSIITKQVERYSTVVTQYLDFVDRFPNSKYLKGAEKYFKQSQSFIKTINNEQIKTRASK